MTDIDLNTIHLAKGSHDDDCGNPERCLFEWYNWLTRCQHTDDCPPDVSPVLHTYGIRLNDALGDERRQELKRCLPGPDGTSILSGTRDDGRDKARSYLALDWLIRTYTPAWLDLAGLTAEAQALRDLRRIVDLVAAKSAGPVVREVRTQAAAAWAAAWDAARAAAGDAAMDAAVDAAVDAAWDAARAAAGRAAGAAAVDAAWDGAVDAAWDAAGDAAGDAARAAAGASAWDAAGAAARAAAGDAAVDAAWDAAVDAAWDALRPTVDQLQTSAIGLYDAMINPTPPSGEAA